MKTAIILVLAVSAVGCGHARTTVSIVGGENAPEAVALGQQGVFVAHDMTFTKGNYNVLEWKACRKIESVLIHDEESRLPEVVIKYSDKECGT
jgi:hypothetical protein